MSVLNGETGIGIYRLFELNGMSFVMNAYLERLEI